MTANGGLINILSDYLDRGDYPPREFLDRDPARQIALDALLRFRSVVRTLLDADLEAEPARDDTWVTEILTNIRREARAGRSIPLSHPSPHADLTVTEGAVRGLIRAAGDSIPGTLIGTCRLNGDVTLRGSPIAVSVEASVFWGERIPSVAERIRAAVYGALLRHTELNITAVDIIVVDVHFRRHGRETTQ